MLEPGAVLATVDAEFHVKRDLPYFLNWVPNIFECFSFNFFMLELREVRKKQKLYEKYDNIRKEKIKARSSKI